MLVAAMLYTLISESSELIAEPVQVDVSVDRKWEKGHVTIVGDYMALPDHASNLVALAGRGIYTRFPARFLMGLHQAVYQQYHTGYDTVQALAITEPVLPTTDMLLLDMLNHFRDLVQDDQTAMADFLATERDWEAYKAQHPEPCAI